MNEDIGAIKVFNDHATLDSLSNFSFFVSLIYFLNFLAFNIAPTPHLTANSDRRMYKEGGHSVQAMTLLIFFLKNSRPIYKQAHSYQIKNDLILLLKGN